MVRTHYESPSATSLIYRPRFATISPSTIMSTAIQDTNKILKAIAKLEQTGQYFCNQSSAMSDKRRFHQEIETECLPTLLLHAACGQLFSKGSDAPRHSTVSGVRFNRVLPKEDDAKEHSRPLQSSSKQTTAVPITPLSDMIDILHISPNTVKHSDGSASFAIHAELRPAANEHQSTDAAHQLKALHSDLKLTSSQEKGINTVCICRPKTMKSLHLHCAI